MHAFSILDVLKLLFYLACGMVGGRLAKMMGTEHAVIGFVLGFLVGVILLPRLFSLVGNLRRRKSPPSSVGPEPPDSALS